MSRVRLKLFIFMGLLAFSVVIIFVIGWFANSQELTVRSSHAQNVFDYNQKAYDEGDTDTKAATINKSGQAVRLTKGGYVVEYEGTSGYSSGQIRLDLDASSKTIVIRPFFSSTVLDASLEKERAAIEATLNSQYPDLAGLYNIKGEQLYHYGEWYGAQLQYKGNDFANADGLLVVLWKNKNQWQVKTDPPAIYLNKHFYKDVPDDILDDLNNNRSSVLLEKFVHPDTSHGPDGQ